MFDEETGLYYLKNRFYSVIWSRFVNIDRNTYSNLFFYCENNPIVKFDPSGCSSIAIDPPTFNSFLEKAKELASLDGPYPVLDAVALGLIVVGVFATIQSSPLTNEEEIFNIVHTSTMLLQNGIDEAMRKAINQQKDKRSQGYDAHHIVPKAHPECEYARQVLEGVGIDPYSSPQNIVTLSRQFHKFLNNPFYNSGINYIMHKVVEYTEKTNPNDPSGEALYANVSLALYFIQNSLLVADNAVFEHLN